MSADYTHTQIGYMPIVAAAILAAAGVTVASSTMRGGGRLPLATFAGVGISCLVLLSFGWMRTAIDHGTVHWRIGPGLLQRTIPVQRIADVSIVRNPWYYGLGIRRTPAGWLYSVSGRSAVQITLTGGTRVQAGTDEPLALRRAIEAAVHVP